MIDLYFLLKWLHVVSAAVLFGAGLGTAAQMWLAHKRGNVAGLAVVTRNVVQVDWVFTGVSGVVQPVSGLLLVWIGGYGFFEPWLIASYVLFVVAAVCWFAVLAVQIRLRDMAAKSAAGATGLPPDYRRLMAWWVGLGWPAFLGLLAVFYLMVTKPFFGD